MKKQWISMFALLITASSFAATYTRKEGDTLWSTLSQWNITTALPGSADSVQLNSGRVLTADIDATVTSIYAPNASSQTATLEVTNNITLTASTLISIGRAAYANSIGIMNHSAGTVNTATLTVSGSTNSTATYNMSGSAILSATTLDIGQVSDSRAVGTGTFNQTGGSVSVTTLSIAGRQAANYSISKGTINATDILVGNGSSAGRSSFNIIGSDALISASNDLTVGPRGKLSFDLDANGVAAINVTDLFNVSSSSAMLVIDAALYTGGATNIDLITFGSIGTTFSASQISITNLNSSLTASIEQDADSIYLNIIPEPTSVGLFIISGLTLMIWRHNNRI